MRRRLTLAPIVLVACLGAAEAKATVVTGTFSGLIDHGVDYTGVFGPANTSLDGLRYTETFTYDTSKGLRGTFPTVDQVAQINSQEPVLTYSLTINGVTDTILLTHSTFVAVLPGHDFRLGGLTGVFTTVGDIAYGTAFDNLDHPKSFDDTVNGPGTPFPGFAQKANEDHGSLKYLYYYMVFDTQRVNFLGDGAQSAAPEPASWVMMLAGFLATGGVMRRSIGGRRLCRAMPNGRPRR